MRIVTTLSACTLAFLAGCSSATSFFSGGDSAAKKRDAPKADAATPAPAKAKRGGTLLLAGGGRTPGAVIAEAARLTSGEARQMLVLPLASSAPAAGQAAVATWTKAGFAECQLLDIADPSRAAAQIDAATFLWMVGGDQAVLAGKLLDGALAARLTARFEAGALVGGTSAGAAAVSELLLVGAEKDDEMQQGRVETVGGLGLWPGVIVDQHFVARRRFNRLMAAVLDHPRLVGVGIDEETGVVVEGATFRVVGDGNVVVIDARNAKVNASRPGDASAATGVEMQVLSAGMTFDLGRR
jgi:cyanophycinase